MKETLAQNGSTAVRSNKFLTVRNMTFIAVMAALVCVAGPWSIPMPGLVPITLASFAVYLAGGILGWKKGTVAVLIYVILGAVGVPVFSGGAGGFAKLFGVTGGYIFGYIPCALLSGLFADLFYKKNSNIKNKFLNWLSRAWSVPVGMILGTVALYALGTVWFIVARGVTLEVAMAGCVLPFLPGDVLKILLAALLTGRLKKAMWR